MRNQTRLSAIWIGATLLTWAMAATPSDAGAILYHTTDLGVGFDLQRNADGSTYGITNGAGTTTYAFNKVPVTPIDVQLPTQSLYAVGGDIAKTKLTMQVGPYQAGTKEVSDAPKGIFYVPSFQTPLGLRDGNASLVELTDAWIGRGPTDTVRDLNLLGQAVGLGFLHPGKSDGTTYAAFSAPGLVGHGGYSPTVDNLNNYIAPFPNGMTLDVAGIIDDKGRIIADGSDVQGNRHSHLLTPVALGDAATVPEPTTLATLAVLGGALYARTRNRRRRINHAEPTS